MTIPVTVSRNAPFLSDESLPAIGVRLIQFCPADGGREAHRSTRDEEPIRLEVGQTSPRIVRPRLVVAHFVREK